MKYRFFLYIYSVLYCLHAHANGSKPVLKNQVQINVVLTGSKCWKHNKTIFTAVICIQQLCCWGKWLTCRNFSLSSASVNISIWRRNPITRRHEGSWISDLSCCKSWASKSCVQCFTSSHIVCKNKTHVIAPSIYWVRSWLISLGKLQRIEVFIITSEVAFWLFLVPSNGIIRAVLYCELT